MAEAEASFRQRWEALDIPSRPTLQDREVIIGILGGLATTATVIQAQRASPGHPGTPHIYHEILRLAEYHLLTMRERPRKAQYEMLQRLLVARTCPPPLSAKDELAWYQEKTAVPMMAKPFPAGIKTG